MSKCKRKDCEALGVFDSLCFGHLGQAQRITYIECAKNENKRLLFSGRIDANELSCMFGEPLRDTDGVISTPVVFDNASVDNKLRITNMAFCGGLSIKSTSFNATLEFEDCRFAALWINNAQIYNAIFRRCNFERDISICDLNTKLKGSISFAESDAEGNFIASTISGVLRLEKAKIKGDVDISSVDAGTLEIFNGSEFYGYWNIQKSTVGNMHIKDSIFKRRASFRSVNVTELWLQGVDWASHVNFDLGFEDVVLVEESRFHRGGSMTLHTCETRPIQTNASEGPIMHGAHNSAAKPSVVDVSDMARRPGEIRLRQTNASEGLMISGAHNSAAKPSVVDVSNSDLKNITFSKLDMSRCVFYSARNVDQVQIESTVDFAYSRRPYGRRQCIADEFAWRLQQGGALSWRWSLRGLSEGKLLSASSGLTAEIFLPRLEPEQVAGVYRGIRRSFEAKSNQPGASDFYFGEMEMRKHSQQSSLSDKSIIWIYWLTCGYGLRASRAFLLLALLILACAIVFSAHGFSGSEKYEFSEYVIFSIKVAIPGMNDPKELVGNSRYLEIILAVLGPVLFALGALALRGRVKR
jgi:uncharacterized protein YjbI with pentapeptide repeats